MRRGSNVALLLPVLVVLAGCHTDMWRQNKALPQQPFNKDVFADGMADRPNVEGTVAWGKNHDGDPKYQAFANGKLVKSLPATLTIGGKDLSTLDPDDLRRILSRGRERYEVFCIHCHGVLGAGDGMITQRGLALRRKPANYNTDRLRKLPIGHFFNVITNGFGVMFPYGARIDVDDRWAIAAYIRALQKSQDVPASTLSPEEVKIFDTPPPPIILDTTK